LILAYRTKQILDQVCNPFDPRLPGGTSATLEAMGLAEQLIKQCPSLRMIRAALKIEQQLTNCLAMLGLLFLEGR
jgi:hypothetical protein